MSNNKRIHFIDIEVSCGLSFLMVAKLDSDIVDRYEDTPEMNDLIKSRVVKIKLTDRNRLFKWKEEVLGGHVDVVGYNIRNFDLPVVMYCCDNTIDNYSILKEEVDKYVLSQDNKEVKSKIKRNHKDIYNINILDLYLCNGWDNDARRASLKWIACNINSNNIVENTLDLSKTFITEDEQKAFLRYCFNDILETIKIYKYSKDMITMREELFNIYKDKMIKTKYIREGSMVNPFLSMSNTQLGASIIEIELALREKKTIKQMNDDYKKNRIEVKYSAPVDKILFPKVKDKIYSNKEIYEALSDFVGEHKVLHVNSNISAKYRFKNTIKKYGLDDTIIQLGKGGAHGLLSEGTFRESDNSDYEIIDFDVSGYYPQIVLNNKIYPINTGEAFIDVYHYLKSERSKHPKGSTINKAYKESLNAVIGLSNSTFASKMFDPTFFMRITINGQLLILLLLEDIKSKIDIDLIMFNTDGCTILIRKKDREVLNKIFADFTKEWGYDLEITKYESIIFEHINSYIAISKVKPTDDKDREISLYEFIRGGYLYKVKAKGDMIPDYKQMEPHKNTGMRIVNLAAYRYFVFRDNVIDVVTDNISKAREGDKEALLSFAGFVRVNSNTKLYYQDVEGTMHEYKGKVLRYVHVTKDNPKAVILFRHGTNGYTMIDKKHSHVMICNDVNDITANDLDPKAYIDKIKTKIRNIEKNNEQCSIFAS